jgi:hypothetical protein
MEHCAHLCWKAFITAESGMRNLFYNVEGMWGSDRTMSLVHEQMACVSGLRISARSETAPYQLRSNLGDVRHSATECKQGPERIKGKFEYLVDFVAALQESTMETKSE